MTRPLKDVSKSVHTRLLNLAKKTGRPFAELFRLYAMERFLYRLSKSPHVDKFILKGGLMIRVWDPDNVRPTKDIDLLGQTQNSTENLTRIVRDICAQAVEPDGMRFDAETVEGALIKEDAEYQGVRVKFLGFLGPAEAAMQLDVGFGDSLVPGPVDIEVPGLLDFPPAHLRAYQRETTIAEKLHAMVVLGSVNGRMKDFYDLWFLAQRFRFEGRRLRAAVDATFRTRETAVEPDPIGLSDAFATEAQARWSAFLKKAGLEDAPLLFSEVVASIREFLGPVLSDAFPPSLWSPGGPWEKEGSSAPDTSN